MSLHPDHLADLKSSGLSDTTIAIMEAYSLPPREIPKLLARDLPDVESALAFPYFDASGKRNDFMRVKLFPEIKDKDGHKIKYIQKKDSSPHLYILPPVATLLHNIEIPLYITEGEKKTAKAVELGLCAVGIGGVWSWTNGGSRDLITDFETLNLWRRKVIIVPDSDAWAREKKSEQIRRGVYYLARELKARGSEVGFLEVG